MVSRVTLRRRVQELLQTRDFPALVALAGQADGVPPLLLQFLFNPQNLLYWRALEGLGEVARGHPEQVKKVIGRLLWMLNEDSGSAGWGAAAALGEIARQAFPVVSDIIPMFCGFLEKPFSRGAMLWGLGRLAEVRPEALAEVLPCIRLCLKDQDPEVRGLGAWTLGMLRDQEAREDLEALLKDEAPLTLYEQGELNRTTVAHLAREALARLK
jgi:hypothetical protein